MNDLIKDLSDRGLVSQITNEEKLSERLNEGAITLYCGFDPTADSLHLGHLVPLLCLKRFQMSGHKPVALVGGATGLIGDPSERATERQLNELKTVEDWVQKIKKQVSPFLDFDCGVNSAKVVNNHDWFGKMDVLTFLRDVGKHFSVNTMVNKESVRQRISREDRGISFTEFSYSLLQSYDFARMNRDMGVELQIGGSDQWGNITTGIDLTRKLNQSQVYGFTVPLIKKADGTKFGKTAGGAIWLDSTKTSIYKFYQFWLNTADADVYQFLRFFTFLSESEIIKIEHQDKTSDSAPQAQKILANEVTKMIHGEDGLAIAQRITASLFHNNVSNLSEEDFAQLALDGMPTIECESNELLQALVDTGLFTSKNQARVAVESNSISINGNKQNNVKYSFVNSDKLFGKYTLIRRGKKAYSLIVCK